MNVFGKTTVQTAGGPEDVFQWSEFRYAIADRYILFRVTTPSKDDLRKGFRFIVTHAASGYRVTDFGFDLVAKTRFNKKRNNYGRAGAIALARVIEDVGEAKVAKAMDGYPDE